ncbi:DUF4321 domain-containing protein [Helicovermis profundi]|uniref:DUF4321 domain-containing protein n=1 Tax=Helicovermis profundi TaxID=3065157 RepID=A0AAU9EAW7_9FIRM|nr:hypothetical protein HLPR_22630 [Clostridia bacterium S502]
MKATNKNTLVLLIVLLIGLVIGGIIGDIFKNYISVLSYGKTIGFSPVTIDLGIVEFTLGFLMHLNLSSIIGILIAFIIFRKM